MIRASYKLLIVDDSVIIVDRLLSLLTELDCISYIGKAHSYIEAEEQLQKTAFDIVLLDINLPDKNGIELLSHVKDAYPEIKTVMLTNQSNEHYRNLCEKMGSDHFVDKTSDFEKIPEIIHNFFSDIHKV
jgi:DNA-binding NarL/FixJ family response regulator